MLNDPGSSKKVEVRIAQQDNIIGYFTGAYTETPSIRTILIPHARQFYRTIPAPTGHLHVQRYYWSDFHMFRNIIFRFTL